MEQEKNNKGVIALLVVVIAVLLTLVVLFITGTINFKSNNNDNVIETKRESVTCMDAETTLNGITIKVTPKHDAGCHTNSLVINGKEVEVDGNIISYEIYDNNVIIFFRNAKMMKSLTIYNPESDSTISTVTSSNLDGFKIDSYETKGNIIAITGTNCEDECGKNATDKLVAKFEINYSNNAFSAPKLIEKYTTQDLVDSVKINGITFDKPHGGKFGGSEKSYTLAINMEVNVDCTNDFVAGINVNGYCLDNDDNKYIFEGPTGVGAFYCNNNKIHTDKGFIQASQILKSNGNYYKIPDETKDINWDELHIKYCKFDEAYLRLTNMSKVATKVELNYEKEFN